MAVAIIAIVTVVLLGRRVEIIRDTTRARDQRLAWALLAHKMAEIELDQEIFLGDGGGNSGDFQDLGSEYAGFEFRWEASKMDVPSNDPMVKTEKPRTTFRIRLFVKKVEEEGDLATIEAEFPVQERKEAGP
ncbi:MAG: hypothetical protein HYY17_16590 [Planctomycetes bacterium]|nr:hypothetical protein [Planctomycetota bacterium]